MKTSPFSPGFRISACDAAVLCGGIAGCLWFYENQPLLAFILGCAVGHFFLFCNVFRISRHLELIWATGFVGLVLAHTIYAIILHKRASQRSGCSLLPLVRLPSETV